MRSNEIVVFDLIILNEDSTQQQSRLKYQEGIQCTVVGKHWPKMLQHNQISPRILISLAYTP